jgi:hypothetical protein
MCYSRTVVKRCEVLTLKKPSGARLYDQAAVAALLGFDVDQIQELHSGDTLPCATHESCSSVRPAFGANYIHFLNNKLTHYPAHLQNESIDTAFFRLCLIEWKFTNEEDTSKVPRVRAKAACNELVKQGDAYTSAMLAAMTGKSSSIVNDWGKNGTLPCARVGLPSYGFYYVSRRYGDYLSKIMTKWLTIDDVAVEAGVSPSTVARWIDAGHLVTVPCPDGRSRISRKSANPLIDGAFSRNESYVNDEQVLTVREAADKLNVPQSTLEWAISEGHVHTVRAANLHSNVRVTVAEVVRWEERFRTLNEPFAWLTAHVTHGNKLPTTITTTQVCRMLNVWPSTVTTWLREGLLPFYRRSFILNGRASKDFVRQYIVGLGSFAGSNKVTLPVVREYYLLCKNREMIV